MIGVLTLPRSRFESGKLKTLFLNYMMVSSIDYLKHVVLYYTVCEDSCCILACMLGSGMNVECNLKNIIMFYDCV